MSECQILRRRNLLGNPTAALFGSYIHIRQHQFHFFPASTVVVFPRFFRLIFTRHERFCSNCVTLRAHYRMKMSLRFDWCLAHPSSAWLLLSALVFFLWLPFISAFGVPSLPFKSSREVIGSRRHMFPLADASAVVAEVTAAVADGDFLPVLAVVAVIALRVLGGYLLGMCLGYLITTPSLYEIRSKMNKTNRELDDLQTKIERLGTKIERKI